MDSLNEREHALVSLSERFLSHSIFKKNDSLLKPKGFLLISNSPSNRRCQHNHGNTILSLKKEEEQ